MTEYNINEEEAYRRIQKYSMNKQKSMKEVAEAVILAWEMKKRFEAINLFFDDKREVTRKYLLQKNYSCSRGCV